MEYDQEPTQTNSPVFPGEKLLAEHKPLPSFIPLSGTRVVSSEDTDAIIVADAQHRALLAIHVGDLTSDRDSDDNYDYQAICDAINRQLRKNPELDQFSTNLESLTHPELDKLSTVSGDSNSLERYTGGRNLASFKRNQDEYEPD